MYRCLFVCEAMALMLSPVSSALSAPTANITCPVSPVVLGSTKDREVGVHDTKTGTETETERERETNSCSRLATTKAVEANGGLALDHGPSDNQPCRKSEFENELQNSLVVVIEML